MRYNRVLNLYQRWQNLAATAPAASLRASLAGEACPGSTIVPQGSLWLGKLRNGAQGFVSSPGEATSLTVAGSEGWTFPNNKRPHSSCYSEILCV